jgi:SPP1 gp7 family putative phage head morphogenesis protein
MEILGFDISFKKKAVSAKVEAPGSAVRRNPKIVKIAETFKDTSRKDIAKWRSALLAAENIDDPKFNQYHDLLKDLMTDGHLKSQIQMRTLSTLNTDHRVYNRKTAEENVELGFILHQQWFYKYLGFCLATVLQGTTLVEFKSFEAEKVDIGIIPRRNVVPTRKKILPDITKPDFINYQDETLKPWLIELSDNDDELGILNNIIPNLIWRRNVMQAWAEFCEKFGLPLITATTNTTDSTVIDNVHEMLLSLGEASVGTFPPGTEIKFQEANRTDAYNVYKQFMQTNTDDISKMIVGSTMLSDQGSNRSQTEVHERSLDNKIAQADKRMIQFMVNDQLFPLLRLQGYNISEDDVFEFKTAEQEIDLVQLWSIVQGLIGAGYDVEQDWISKTFNIPLGAKKKIQQPNIAAGYFPENKPFERYEFTCTCGEHVQAVDKPSKDKVKKLSDDLADFIFNGKDTIGTEGELIAEEANVIVKGLRSKFTTAKTYAGNDHLALQMMEYNVFDFSASKTESRLAAMNSLLIDDKTKKLREFADYKKQVDKITGDYNAKWLETEYNLAVSVGQNSASYIRFMNEKDTVTKLVKYQTVGDESVRDAHAILNGKIFSLEDTEAMKLFPPNGFGCRCEFIQYLGRAKKSVISGDKGMQLISSRDPRWKNSQFEVNRGDLKQVFTNKQFYSANKGLENRINKMTYDKYGLKKSDDLRAGKKDINLDNTITKANVKELFKKEKGTDHMGFTDYLGRKMILPEKNFDNNAIVRGQKHQVFPHMQDILNSPDEVWMHEKTKQNFKSRYVKYYGDRAVLIDVQLNEKMEGLEITGWRNLAADEAKERLGIKIR